MSGSAVDTFVASLKRCLARPGFLEQFYEAFLGSSDEVRQKFSHTDMARQARVLRESLFALAVVAQGEPDSVARRSLPELAERHSHAHLDIRPELYDLWLDCLVDTARRHDPEFGPEVEQAWRSSLAVGIEYMRSRY